MNAILRSSVHAKAYLRVFEKGRHLSIALETNLLSSVTLLVNFLTSLTVLDDGISSMTFTISGLASIPHWDIMKSEEL